MIKNTKKLIFIFLICFSYSLNSFADTSHFIDFVKVLNNSKAGADAQNKLKKRVQTETQKFKELEKKIKAEESEIISQKKLLSADEYKKKVENLRKKVSNLRKDKSVSFNNISKSRADARKALINATNPIIQKYMEDNNIKIVLNKNAVILGDVKLEITDQIIATLNKELTSLKIN